MTEFKQIVGRGTRVHEDSDKYYFTLIDFRKATNHFADPDFDGEPVQIYEPGEGDPITPPDPDETTSSVVQEGDGTIIIDGEEVDDDEIEVIVDTPTGPNTSGDDEEPKKKIYVNGVAVKVL